VPVETAIYSVLCADGTVSPLVGTRIYPEVAPPGAALPHIVYTRISTPRIRSLGGTSGLLYPRFQIVSWASSYSGAKALADAVRNALDDYSGVVGTITVEDVYIEDEGDMMNLSPDVDALRMHGVRQDFIIWHRE